MFPPIVLHWRFVFGLFCSLSGYFFNAFSIKTLSVTQVAKVYMTVNILNISMTPLCNPICVLIFLLIVTPTVFRRRIIKVDILNARRQRIHPSQYIQRDSDVTSVSEGTGYTNIFTDIQLIKGDFHKVPCGFNPVRILRGHRLRPQEDLILTQRKKS